MLYLSKVFPADFAPYARDRKAAPYAIEKLMPISEPSLPRKGVKANMARQKDVHLPEGSGRPTRSPARKGGPDRVP